VVRLALLVALAAGLNAAPACSEADIEGWYGLQLSGLVTISGAEAPVATLARVVSDGHGTVTGYSSVNFNGLLLGNPVTGTYEVRPDCTMFMSLQDDSGAFQHFSGTVAPGGEKVELLQTDAGTGERGIMEKTSDACSAADVEDRYAFTLEGVYSPLAADGASGAISAEGEIHTDATGRFTLTRNVPRPATVNGIFEIDNDCIIRMEFSLPAGGHEAAIPMKLRGILVSSGKEILAIQTDPDVVASARFIVR
jgi:hypothetical protein